MARTKQAKRRSAPADDERGQKRRKKTSGKAVIVGSRAVEQRRIIAVRRGTKNDVDFDLRLEGYPNDVWLNPLKDWSKEARGFIIAAGLKLRRSAFSMATTGTKNWLPVEALKILTNYELQPALVSVADGAIAEAHVGTPANPGPMEGEDGPAADPPIAASSSEVPTGRLQLRQLEDGSLWLLMGPLNAGGQGKGQPPTYPVNLLTLRFMGKRRVKKLNSKDEVILDRLGNAQYHIAPDEFDFTEFADYASSKKVPDDAHYKALDVLSWLANLRGQMERATGAFPRTVQIRFRLGARGVHNGPLPASLVLEPAVPVAFPFDARLISCAAASLAHCLMQDHPAFARELVRVCEEQRSSAVNNVTVLKKLSGCLQKDRAFFKPHLWKTHHLQKCLPLDLRDVTEKFSERKQWVLHSKSDNLILNIVEEGGDCGHVVAVVSLADGRRVVMDSYEPLALPLSEAGLKRCVSPGRKLVGVGSVLRVASWQSRQT